MTSSAPPTLRSVFQQLPLHVRRLIALDVICGILLMLPFFRREMQTPGFGLLAIVLLLPYLVVCWRLFHRPGSKEGPGLAAGIGLVFSLLAPLGVAVSVEGSNSGHMAYFAALGFAHALLVGVGSAAFREGTSTKPSWRVVLRSIIDPVVYYGIVFFLALAGLTRSMFR